MSVRSLAHFNSSPRWLAPPRPRPFSTAPSMPAIASMHNIIYAHTCKAALLTMSFPPLHYSISISISPASVIPVLHQNHFITPGQLQSTPRPPLHRLQILLASTTPRPTPYLLLYVPIPQPSSDLRVSTQSHPCQHPSLLIPVATFSSVTPHRIPTNPAFRCSSRHHASQLTLFGRG